MEITPSQYNLFSLPDEIKICVIAHTCSKKKTRATMAQTMTSLRLTNKYFNALLSDKNIITLLNLSQSTPKKVLNKILMESVQKQSPLFVHLMNKLGADVNYYSKDHALTPLLQATINNDYIMCKLLISRGADVNRDNSSHDLLLLVIEESFLPLHIAIENNNLPITKLLLESGANINYLRVKINPIDMAHEELTTLELAKKHKASREIKKLLVEHPQNLKKQGKCLIQ